jgi:ATP-dependent exoDNAse (exonuclease V) beta subunit
MMSNELVLTDDFKQYKDKDDNRYDRVTSFIHSFVEPFDQNYWANELSGKPNKRVPEYENLTPDQILIKWQVDNRRSLDEGNYVHAKLEQIFNKELVVEHRPDLVPDEYINTYVAFVRKLFNVEGVVVYPEYRLNNKQFKLAGTTDLKIVYNGATSFLDYKTNKKITYTAKYGKYFLEPINFVPQCEYYEYTIQMSLYAFMDKLLNGSVINKLNLLHCKYGVATMIPVTYREDLVIKLLKHSGRY